MVPVRWGVWGGVLIFTEIQGICIQEGDEMLGSTDPFFPSGGCDGGMGPWLHWSLLAGEESSKPLLARPYVGMLRPCQPFVGIVRKQQP